MELYALIREPLRAMKKFYKLGDNGKLHCIKLCLIPYATVTGRKGYLLLKTRPERAGYWDSCVTSWALRQYQFQSLTT